MATRSLLRHRVTGKIAVISIALVLIGLLVSPAKAAVFTEWILPAGSFSPFGITRDTTGARLVWFAEFGSDRVSYLNPASGQFVQFQIETGTHPWDVAWDQGKKNRLYFTESGKSRIGWLEGAPPTGPIFEVSICRALGPPIGPCGLNVDPRGMDLVNNATTTLIYFTMFTGNSIGELAVTSSGPFNGAIQVRAWNLPASGSDPQDLVYDPRTGTVFFAELDGNRIGNLNPVTGRFREWLLPSGSNPWGIALDKDGNVWFSESSRDRVGRLNPYNNIITEWQFPETGTQPFGVVTDAFGNIWIAEHQKNRIARLNPQESVIVEFTRQPSGNPFELYYDVDPGIALPDKRVWFTDDGARIGSLDPNSALTTTTVSFVSLANTQESTVTPSTQTASLTTTSTTTSYTTTSTTPTTRTTTSTQTGSTVFTVPEISRVLQTTVTSTVTALSTSTQTNNVGITSTVFTSTSFTTVTSATPVTSTSAASTQFFITTRTTLITTTVPVVSTGAGGLAAIPGFPIESILAGLIGGIIILGILRRKTNRNG